MVTNAYIIAFVWTLTGCSAVIKGAIGKSSSAGETPAAAEAPAPAPPFAITGRTPLVVAPGAQVALTGTGFAPGLTVGDGAATVANETSASFTAPTSGPFGPMALTARQGEQSQTITIFFDAGKNDHPIMTADVATVCAGVKFYDATGTLTEGTRDCTKAPALPDCAADGATDCRAVASYPAAKLDAAHLAPGNVKAGVTIAGVAGGYPSVAHPLPGASATADLTAFATQAKHDDVFEYWDSAGQRRTASGDADLADANVRDGVALDAYAVTGQFKVDPWDLRAGVVSGAVTGKLRVNCRNAMLSAFYNYDGDPATIPAGGVTTGTTLDWWDSITDASNVPTAHPTPWALNYCGGLETVAGDDNVWKDVTTGGCDATKCRYKDKISGLEWSKVLHVWNGPGRTWPQAVNDCATSSHDGVGGWRLPTQKEMLDAYAHGMKSVGHANFIQPALASYVWSASSMGGSTTLAFAMLFDYGTGANQNKGNQWSVMCVR